LDTRRIGWKEDEDILLRALVSKHGDKSWTAIANELPGREPKQCRERWVNHLRPGVRKGKITEAEWAEILKLQETHGNKWSEIARFLPGRTPNQIKNYWHSQVRSAKEYNQQPDKPMIMGPEGQPIPIPQPFPDNNVRPATAGRKRTRIYEADGDERSLKTLRTEEAIQVQMPEMPPFPDFGLPKLDIAQIPVGGIFQQMFNVSDDPDPNFLAFIPIVPLPDPASLVDSAGDGNSSNMHQATTQEGFS